MRFYSLNMCDNFECVGSECIDTCCRGWKIYIDKETGEYYRSVEGEFGDKLRKYVKPVDENRYEFTMVEGNRCPFLNEKNLCEIYINLGKDKLCKTCARYPRLRTPITSNSCFAKYSLSCPEVVKLLLTDDKKADLKLFDDGKNRITSQDDEKNMMKLQDGMILTKNLLQLRELSIQDRLRLVIYFNNLYEKALKQKKDTTKIVNKFVDKEYCKKLLKDQQKKTAKNDSAKLDRFILDVFDYFYSTGKESTLYTPAQIAMPILEEIRKDAAGYDMDKVLANVKTEQYNLYFEQYLIYEICSNYLMAYKDYEIIKGLEDIIYLYSIHYCFLAMLTEIRGRELTLAEVVNVFNLFAKKFEREHSEDGKDISKLREICNNNELTGKDGLLSIL